MIDDGCTIHTLFQAQQIQIKCLGFGFWFGFFFPQQIH